MNQQVTSDSDIVFDRNIASIRPYNSQATLAEGVDPVIAYFEATRSQRREALRNAVAATPAPFDILITALRGNYADADGKAVDLLARVAESTLKFTSQFVQLDWFPQGAYSALVYELLISAIAQGTDLPRETRVSVIDWLASKVPAAARLSIRDAMESLEE